ncbi:MAG: AAA family ATPase [Proteobacteria bacterium]|nr:AAA family ATPase [Pseudomonadota bacterium]MBU1058024.1 AAA family ATPase [Pseudomonadota bacterium]
MYTNYFGFKEKPFSIAPDPRYLYMSELHREALAHLLYGISSDGCFILLTGDVGTGKTTVCRCLLEQLPDNTDVALIVNPRLTDLELLETICDELEIPLDEGERSAKFYIDNLNRYLLDAHARGRNTALLIDEAQNLSLDLLELLRLLTNLETHKKKLLKIVLLGQSELRQILENSGADQISQRITSRYHLLPLGRADVFAYIRHRLVVAGVREKLFSEAALTRIYQLTQGIPRLTNVVCDRALLGAYVEGRYQVNASIVEQAAEEVLGTGGRRAGRRNKRRLLLTVLLALLLFILGVGAATFYFSKNISLESVLPSKGGQVEKMKEKSNRTPALAAFSFLAASPCLDLGETRKAAESGERIRQGRKA